MPNQPEVLHDVPTEDKEEVESDFRAAGATAVAWTKQGNGLWTATATFPPGGKR